MEMENIRDQKAPTQPLLSGLDHFSLRCVVGCKMKSKDCSVCKRKLYIGFNGNGNDFCRPGSCRNSYFCPLCAMVSVANRKFHMPSCKTCNTTITEFFYYLANRTTMQACEGMASIDHGPDLVKDQVRYYESNFKNLRGEEKGKKCILSISFPLPTKEDEEEEFTFATLTACLDTHLGSESVDDEIKLRQIFSVLHMCPCSNTVREQVNSLPMNTGNTPFLKIQARF